MEEKKKETKPENGKKGYFSGLPVRSCMLMCLAGVYLLYTGYRLCRNVLDGVGGGGAGFFVAGIAFVVLGAGMLFVGVRGVIAEDKRKKAEDEEE